jgi:hypothetical protein
MARLTQAAVVVAVTPQALSKVQALQAVQEL